MPKHRRKIKLPRAATLSRLIAPVRRDDGLADSRLGMSNRKRGSSLRSSPRLAEIGLGKSLSNSAMTSTGKVSAERAKELVGKTIDRLGDPAASAEENATRQRRLIKGPSEFREQRVDRGKGKA